MNNIFANNYFGKPYKTRDGRKAIYSYCIKGKPNEHYIIVDKNHSLLGGYDDNGIGNACGYHNLNLDIISEWIEPIICKCQWNDYYDYRIMLPNGEGHVRVSFFEDEIIISDLFVVENCRNKGYATILLDKVDELLKGKAAKITPLQEWQEDWYKKRGYTIYKE